MTFEYIEKEHKNNSRIKEMSTEEINTIKIHTETGVVYIIHHLTSIGIHYFEILKNKQKRKIRKGEQ